MLIPENVSAALSLLERAGYEAFLVGGCVRDFIRGKAPSDYDITTPSTPEETREVFRDFPVFLQGEKHGTVGVIINGEKLEITTHRRDGAYLDHRRPESVSFSRALADDLSRRDFTVNSLAFSPRSGLVDLFGGVCDIENKVIRCVGEPKRRFDEDALRILRAVRFSSTLGFEIEDNTKKAIFEHKNLLKAVSAERVREELEKLVRGDAAARIVGDWQSVLSVVTGEIDTELFVGECSRLSGDEREALLFCATGCDAVEKLKFSREKARFLLGTRELFFAPAFSSTYELKKSLSCHGEKAVRTALTLKNDKAGLFTLDKIIENGECFNKKDMKISGADLAAIGFEQGTKMGWVLDTLFDMILQDKLPNQRQKLIEYSRALKD